jgi:hypothetical protein
MSAKGVIAGLCLAILAGYFICGSVYAATEAYSTGDVKADGVVQAGAGTNTNPAFAFGSDTDTGMYSAGADALTIATNHTPRLSITSDGNVGINNSSPASSNRLDVLAGAGLAKAIYAKNEQATSSGSIYGVYGESAYTGYQAGLNQYGGYFKAVVPATFHPSCFSYGVFGEVTGGAIGTQIGVYGKGYSRGVQGYSTVGTGVYGDGVLNGVYGVNNSSSGNAIRAQQSNASGYAPLRHGQD